jgi:hypothetical protein
MSNRPCNLCCFKQLSERAAKEGFIIFSRGRKGKLGGVDIHLLRKGETPSRKNWRVWYMELPERCAC